MLLCVSLALLGLLVVQRLVPLSIRQSANDVNGVIYAATYVLSAITLAFSLYMGNQEVSEAKVSEAKVSEAKVSEAR